jgi:hypothetical protein
MMLRTAGDEGLEDSRSWFWPDSAEMVGKGVGAHNYGPSPVHRPRLLTVSAISSLARTGLTHSWYLAHRKAVTHLQVLLSTF